MDSSRISEIRKNATINCFFTQNPSGKKELSLDDMISNNLGGREVIFNGALVNSIQPNFIYSSIDSASIQTLVMNALTNLLVDCAATNIGPTRSSRMYYLFFFTVAAAYNWVAGDIRGVKDNWDWSQGSRIDNADVYRWMVLAINHSMPKLVSGWTPSISTTYISEFTTFSNAWDSWWAYRVNDGNLGALAPPSTSLLPNGNTLLEVTTSQDFTNSVLYPEPKKWTPLSISGVPKRYLTYNWESVKSTCLTAADDTAIASSAQTLFPTDSEHTSEIGDLLTLTSALTDTQKVIAEFWAGGPNTVTPPGMFIWLWKEFILGANIRGVNGLSVLFKSGLDLAAGLFESSRLAWKLKYQNLQARPIQDIRRIYNGTNVTLYNGTVVNGNVWVPFQPPTIVTPPFPDFPSGHSTFSQTFALIMSDWFGASIPTMPGQFSNIRLLSPILQAQTGNFGSFTINTGTSETQPAVVPAAPVTLTWTTWQQIADSAGISRQYGGIHCTSADTGGKAVANSLRPLQKAYWGLR